MRIRRQEPQIQVVTETPTSSTTTKPISRVNLERQLEDLKWSKNLDKEFFRDMLRLRWDKIHKEDTPETVH